MEFILFLVAVIVATILWARVAELTQRQKLTEAQLAELKASFKRLAQTVAGPASVSKQGPVPAPVAAQPEAGPLAQAPAQAPAAATPAAAPQASMAFQGGSGPTRAAPALPPVERAEWTCQQCGYARNWSSRTSCYSCGTPKLVAPAVSGAAAADVLGRAAATPQSIPAAGTSRAGTPERAPVPTGPGPMARLLVRLGLTPPAAGEGWSRTAIEAWFEGRILAIVGGIALLLGAAFFLSLAFSRNWIPNEMRVLIGLAVGGGLLVLGELSFSRLRGVLGPVLAAVGLAIISLALFAATRLYDLVPVELALLGSFIAAAAAAVTAVRHDSEIVAAFGLISVLASPPVLGADPSLVTVLFVGATLVGTTGVALFRTWPWLPFLAFVLAAPQLAVYVNGAPPAAEALIAVAAFWLVNLVAAGGEEVRHATDRLRSSTVTLLLADAAFTLWSGFTVLSGTLEQWRGTFLVVQAGAYIGLALVYFIRNGDRHPFGLIVAATGVASLTMAVPIQFGGPPVPIAWAAEAVALAAVAVVRRHPYSAALSILLAILALGHLVSIEYAPDRMAIGFPRSIPFVGPEGLTFAFMIAAVAVAAAIVPIAWVRAWLGVVAGVVALYVFGFELAGPARVGAWGVLAAVGLVAYARVVRFRIAAGFRETRVAALGLPRFAEPQVADAVGLLSRVARPSVPAFALVAGIFAAGHFVLYEYPADLIWAGTPHDIPFVGLPGLAFAILLVEIAATGLLIPIAPARVGLTALAGLLAFYVFPFELSGPALVAAWTALGTLALVVEALVIEPRFGPAFDPASVMRFMRPAIRAVGAIAGVAVLGHLVVLDFPADQLGRQVLSNVPYAGPEGLSLAAALAGLAVGGAVTGARWIRLGATGIGAALLVFTVTYEVELSLVIVPWGLLALASVFLVRRVVSVTLVPSELRSWLVSTAPLRRIELQPLVQATAERLPFAAAGLAVVFLAVRSLVLAPAADFGQYVTGELPLAGAPFLDQRTPVLLILAATLLITGWIWRGLEPRVLGAVAAAVAIAWLMPFEVRPGYAVAGWSALALAGISWLRIVQSARLLLVGTYLTLVTMGAVVALAIVAPPSGLVVSDGRTVLGWSLLTDATVALGALAIAFGTGGLLHRRWRLSLPVLAAAGVTTVYLLSLFVVDRFQLQVGTRPLEDLQKEAQVGLSVLWSVLGAAGFAAGLSIRKSPVRLFGLGLLGLATAKVFLVDLAALDVSYRVMSLAALGVLLLISSAVFSRLERARNPASL